MDSSSSSSGLLIGGSDNGVISIYDARKILSGDVDDSMVFQSTKHTGNQAIEAGDKDVGYLLDLQIPHETYFFALYCRTGPSSGLQSI